MGKLVLCVAIAALTLGLGGFVSVAKASTPVIFVQTEETKCEKCGHLPSKPEHDCKCECHKKAH
ncbi:MAG TPA: hypothetical protein ACFYD6_14975 [Candidatus Brocadiia bacterium]|nr:hypothetical protein [Candidatus Brocadiales bacterium]